VFESVFFRPLEPGERIAPVRAPALEGLTIRRVSPSEPRAVRGCATAVASGFTPPGVPVRPEDVETWERCARHPRTTLFGAFVGETCVGAGSVEVSGPISTLFGLSVLAPFRRRGVQQALMAARLQWAATNGARFSTISARPGVGTIRNARRMGFQVVYTKVHLVRPGSGLIPVAT
jgi:GNAT superfamily N-acetyltransferase